MEIKPTRAGKQEQPQPNESQITSQLLDMSIHEQASDLLEKLSMEPENCEDRRTFSAFYSVEASVPSKSSSKSVALDFRTSDNTCNSSACDKHGEEDNRKSESWSDLCCNW